VKTVADGAAGRVSFRYILAVFLVTRIALCTVAVIASTMAGRPREGVPLEPLTGIPAVDAWVQWDGFWYLRIARVGYANVDYKYLTDFDAAGFLPLYPWLVRYGSVLWDQPIGVALLISNAAAVCALVVFARLASLDFPADTVRRAIFYVCAFPTSFYLSSVATESLFLFLSVSAFYAARRRQWLWAGVAGALAALSRPVGVLLMPALACEYIVQEWSGDWKKYVRWVPLLLLPLSLASFAYLCWVTWGDPLAYQHRLDAWRGPTTWVGAPLVAWVRNARIYTGEFSFFDPLLSVALTALMIGTWMRNRFSYSVYFLVSLVAPLSGNLQSFSRYALVIFPAFLAFAQLGANPVVDRSITAIFLLVHGLYMALYAASYWIA
jgi:hypothetical protein